ncbi:DUF1911 domain-containing protein [Halomonas pacifica]|uniref:DUF1911 domain-containing protein n=1 Tax=Bisbaumannia pacifica TaxID=77098 RepID=A0A510XCU3_9GAMM|nr:PoNe immunity protein domain-containing protein [Halomonas pacifica]MBH8581984.1 DUF1911 domain-containing protein [Halomonas pacifica]MDC8805599.1 DUF1911 domain-containing protein [Halomonas pacifica]GEK49262.1 hypothetical protein HPA02_35450 [Halomonas pacifica]
MIRDPLKPKDYFDARISFKLECLAEDMEDLAAPEHLDLPARMKVAYGVVDQTLSLLTIRYSRGDEITGMCDEVEQLLTYRKRQKEFADALPDVEQPDRVMWENLTQDSYEQYMQWLAFAAGVGMDQRYFQETLALMDNAGLDALFDRICVQFGDINRPVADTLLYKKHYAPLLKVLDAEPAERPALMKAFLDNWYDNRKGLPGYNLHLCSPDGYYGYWCFEAALVVKLFDIDDSTFRDHRYYPAALVHGD